MSISNNIVDGLNDNSMLEMLGLSQEEIEMIKEQEKQVTKPKRKRRTKAEIEAEKAKEKNDPDLLTVDEDTHITAIVSWDQDEDDDTKLPRKVQIPDSIIDEDCTTEVIGDYLSDTVGYCHLGFDLKWPDYHPDLETFCNWELEQARIFEKEDPDFDYRHYYDKGMPVYLIRKNNDSKTKKFIPLTLRTVYPRCIVGVVEGKYCEVIGFKERDNIFTSREDAKESYEAIDFEEEVED